MYCAKWGISTYSLLLTGRQKRGSSLKTILCKNNLTVDPHNLNLLPEPYSKVSIHDMFVLYSHKTGLNSYKLMTLEEKIQQIFLLNMK